LYSYLGDSEKELKYLQNSFYLIQKYYKEDH